MSTHSDVHPAHFTSEWWRVTLSSIGDAVIVTDRHGRILFMNQIAQDLTGWTEAEGCDRPLDEVFTVFHAETREKVESPIAQVLKSGTTVKFPNNAILVDVNGREFPVDDSGAPIRDEQGNILGMVLVFRDVTERNRAEAANRRLASIVESSDDAIVGKTLESVITSWNRAAEKMFGYSAEEAIGQSIYIIIPPERTHEEEDIIRTLARGERIDHFETVRMTKDGQRLDISLTVSPIKDSYGSVIGVSKIARDISERKRAEAVREQLLEFEQAARVRAEDSNRLKDEFLAIVSHELRTPLNAILGWATLLEGGKLDKAAAHRAIEIIQRNAKSQAQIVNDILDISRIVSGTLRLSVSRMEVLPAIEMAIENMRPAAEEKGIHISSYLDKTVGSVSADPERLQQIIWNLLSNAIKFTPPGGSVQVKLERADADLEISVTDTGEGISNEFLPHVFDRFRQADSSITRTHGGLGLGLAIVRHLVERHGGSVRAESAGKGRGATFTFRLPLASQKDAGLRPVTSEGLSDVPDLTGLTVLVVDDEPDANDLTMAMLQHYGASVVTATSVPQAVEMLERDRIDILVSDLGMPEMNGYDLIKKVRRQGLQIPAVAVTAHAMSEDRLRALAAGYQVHVAKPVNSEELAIVVASLAGIATHAKRARR